MRPPKPLLQVLVACAAVFSACSAPPVVPATTKANLGSEPVAPAFNIYADGSILKLNLPASVSAEAEWSAEPAIGKLIGHGRTGQYISPTNLASSQTVMLRFKTALPKGIFERTLQLNLRPASFKTQANPVGPAGSTLCANEGESCTFTGSKIVAYGASGAYYYRSATDQIDCNNLVYNDPLFGTVKACFVLSQPVPVGPPNTVFCAADGQKCSVSAPHQVSYGEQSTFKTIVANTSIDCSAALFGDPNGSATKACFISRDAVPPTGPADHSFCAMESGRCEFVGTRSVAYGFGSTFVYRAATGGVDCLNSVFSDPLPGTLKACFLGAEGVVAPVPQGPAGYTYCATEGVRCDFAGYRDVAYGANGVYRYQSATGGLNCVNAVFGDPTPGVAKNCFQKDLSGGGGTPPAVTVPNPIATIGGATVFDASKFDGDGFSWSFSDGTSAEGVYVEHTFAQPGKYTATVRYTDAAGRPQSSITTVGVLPEIQNIVKQRAKSDSLTVTFDAGEPIEGFSYTYDFGDGTTGNSSRTSHTYEKIGTYDYQLVVRDTRQPANGLRAAGLSAQATDPGVVYKASSWHTIWRKAPEAKLSFTTPAGQNIGVGTLPLTVNFDAAASRDFNTEQSDLTYAWDFGNGQTATTAQAQTLYKDQKAYLVTLTVKNKWGLADTKRTFVQARSPQSNFTINVKYPTVSAASVMSADEQNLAALTAKARPYTGQASARLGTQDFTPGDDIKNVFPYVLAANNNVTGGIHRPVSISGSPAKSLCNSYKLYVNGAERFPLLSGDDDMFLCDYMIVTAGNIGSLPVRPLNDVLVSTSGGLHSTTFNVFGSLSVPSVFVSIVPDEFIPGEVASPKVSERYYTDEATGKKKYFLNVLVRQSEVGGTVSFKVPVLAVDAQGRFMPTTNGIFNGRFAGLTSDCGDCTMVNGKAYINVSVVPSQYAQGQQQLDLTRVQMFGGTGDCKNDTSPFGQASRNRLSGCGEVVATYDFPTANAPTDIAALPPELSKKLKLGNHIFYGESADAAKAFGLYAQAGHVLVHTFVEYTAPFALIPEKREELQRMTEALTADGTLSVADAAQLSLMNIGIYASAIPVGPLKPVSYATIAAASRNGIGATSNALGDIATNAARGGKTSELEAVLRNKAGALGKLIEGCDTCIAIADDSIDYLKSTGLTSEQALKKYEDTLVGTATKADTIQLRSAYANIVLKCSRPGVRAQSGGLSAQAANGFCDGVNMGHILDGEAKFSGGQVTSGVGYHYAGPNYTPATITARKVPGTETKPNAQGVYQAKVEFLDPATGNWLPKQGKGISSFFPDSMTPAQIQDAIMEAFTSPNFKTGVNGNKHQWEGVASNGLKIQGWFLPNAKGGGLKGDINTAYPVF